MTPRKPPVCIHVAAVLLLFALPLSAHALTPSEVFEQVKDSVFVVKSFDAKGEQNTLGSGVLLPSGKIATNCHVVKSGVSFQVGRGKQFVPATVFAGDEDKDICLLDAKDIGGKPAKVGKAANLKVGEPVYAVGAPQGLELSLSNGIVSQLRGGPPPFIQTTAAISPGSSGGGLFDGNARLVGFTTLYIDGGQSLNFAMPVEWLAGIKPAEKKVAKGGGETDWIKRVAASQERQDWAGMRDLCRQWTKVHPKFAHAWHGLGVAYSNLNQHSDAIDAYRQAVRIDPEFDDAWYNLGVVYGRLKRYNQAIDAYRQAIRINSKNAKVWHNLGRVYGDLKRHTDAIDAYRQAIGINPENFDGWYNLGVVYFAINRYSDSIDAYRQAIRINPDHADTWNNLALAYELSGNRVAALETVQSLRRLDPDRAELLFNLLVPR